MKVVHAQTFTSGLILLSLGGLMACGANMSDRPMSAGALSDHYLRTRSELLSKHNGREIVVRGYAELPARLPGSHEDEGSLELGEIDRKLAHPGICWFSKDQTEAFAQIEAGQLITVKGVFNGEDGANLKFCRLAQVGDKPSE